MIVGVDGRDTRIRRCPNLVPPHVQLHSLHLYVCVSELEVQVQRLENSQRKKKSLSQEMVFLGLKRELGFHSFYEIWIFGRHKMSKSITRFLSQRLAVQMEMF